MAPERHKPIIPQQGECLNRIFGIRHRVKRTAEGEAHPTQVAVLEKGEVTRFDLETEDEELTFLKAMSGQNTEHELPMIPEPGDKIAMILGGSGSSFSSALARVGEGMGVELYRTPPYRLKDARGDDDKTEDSELLARFLSDYEEGFYLTESRDRKILRVAEVFTLRQETMKARMGCNQRLRSFFIGKTFRTEEGFFPEGDIEDLYKKFRASDKTYKALELEEAKWDRELLKALEDTDVYTEVFRTFTGIGPAIAAGIIVAVGDIRRFPTRDKFIAFCGLHVLPDGGFARRRRGQLSNWNPAARQAFYNLMDQFVKRPESEGGIMYRHFKVVFREKHPKTVVDSKTRYSDGHIHKMAMWRTGTRMARKIYTLWTELEESKRAVML